MCCRMVWGFDSESPLILFLLETFFLVELQTERLTLVV